jgi:hypothetical protein
MSLCPDKNSQEFKDLVDAYGRSRAVQAFYRKADGSIPTIQEASTILGIQPNTLTQGQEKWKDFVANNMFQEKSFSQQIKQGLKNKAKQIGEFSKKAIQSVFPSSFQKNFNASLAASILRKGMGVMNRENMVADKASKETMNWWNKKSYNEQLSFIYAMENPDKIDLSGTPGLKELYDSYRDRLDNIYSTISSIKDIPYYEDYFPHFWQDPKKSVSVFAKLNAKRPMEGGKSFLKKRFFEDIKAGLDAGLELATTNPEEMMRIAEMNVTKFQMANDIFKQFKENGLLEYHTSADKIPDGWELVNDSLFKRMTPFAVKEQGVPTGEAGLAIGGWYMPSDAARIVNNYLSRGLAGVKGLRHINEAGRYLNNLKNTFQLGFSLFHFSTTTIDASITATAQGLQKVLTGKPKNIAQGLKMMAQGLTVLPTLSKNYAKANSVYKDLWAGRVSEDIQKLMDANAIPKIEKQWQINATYEFQKSINKIKRGRLTDLKSIPSAVWNGLLVVPEIASKIIMEYHVPRMKVASILNEIKTELDTRGSLTNEEIQKIKETAANNADDRLGQVVYDNYFWDKSLKDLAFLTIRSFGWTGGTQRAIGGGIYDIPKSTKRFFKGEGISPRTAWLMTLPVQVGLYGAFYQYMMTGQPPQELKDYYFPKDGTKNPDGTDHRVSLPTYMKDLFSYKKNPYKTLTSKVSPLMTEAHEIYNNQDFYGVPIYDEDDPSYKKGLDLLKYELKTLEPFGFREKPGPKIPLASQQSIQEKVGLTTAPSMFTRSDLENTINDRLVREMEGQKRKPGYDPNESAFKKMIADQLKQGKSFKEDITLEEKQKAGLVDKEGKYISPAKIANVVKGSKLSNAQRTFKYLSAEGQLNIISKIEQKDIDYLLEKRVAISKKPMEFFNLKRTRPEVFVKHPEYKKAYEILTRRKFDLPEIKEEEDTEE